MPHSFEELSAPLATTSMLSTRKKAHTATTLHLGSSVRSQPPFRKPSSAFAVPGVWKKHCAS
jgi:hypothetical protein